MEAATVVVSMIVAVMVLSIMMLIVLVMLMSMLLLLPLLMPTPMLLLSFLMLLLLLVVLSLLLPSASFRMTRRPIQAQSEDTYRSGSGEVEKWLDVAIIRRSDCFQICRAGFAFLDEISRTPRECRSA